MEIAVCELVPYLNKKVNQYNAKLKEWSSNIGITIISTQLNFRLGTADVDDKF